ncbi:MAG: hypothetical protein QM769_01320 [Pseudoxanthomonas sp.]
MTSMRILPILLSCLLASPLAAQQASHACASVADPAARLACYDKAFPPPPEINAMATEKAQADFGWDKPQEPLRNPGQTHEQAAPDRIESRVSNVNSGPGGQRSFTLENGQIWTQAESRSSGFVKAGDVVQVRKGVMNGFQLVMPNGVSVRVRRTR